MYKDVLQHTDPVALKAMVSGAGTVGAFGLASTSELAAWASIAADIGVAAGGFTSVVLGLVSLRRAWKRRNEK